MPPAAATAAARRASSRQTASDPDVQALVNRPQRATHPNPSRPARRAAVAAPPRPRTAPAAPRTAPSRPRTAPHTAPPRTRTVAPDPRPLRIERPKARPKTRPARPERSAPRLNLAACLRPSGKLLDRIIRGRAWIPVLGVLLVGIVGMRVEVLKLNSTASAQMQTASQLQGADAVLRSQVSALSETSRIQSMAQQLGMIMPSPLDVHLLQSARATNVAKAISNIAPPAASTFLTDLQLERSQDGDIEQSVASTSTVDPGAVASTSTGSPSTTTDSTTPTSGQSDTATSDTGGVSAGDPGATDPTSGDTATGGSSGTGVSTGQPTGTGTPDTQGTGTQSGDSTGDPTTAGTSADGGSSLGG